ncbi:MBL fold metallo-hydrolase [Laspinema olomoucense]|uniref:MBL fold metallo-hydrolase n=1 Tax=Laspinema olomoucense TaxID=3231600 RepID=UPI0021BA8CB3|nr:MBL fold metallo-hydrolase [Laspinema sp. D3c]MCT7997353.1 MBL fold metallo-hydrolase [Laspinema sp. D3c]
MANQQLRRPENVSGDFYVDTTCIDCDTCRWMAPDIFHRDNEQSAVYQQPQTEAERLEALQALLACPTASIGTVDKPKDIKKAQESFPLLIDNNIYHCGYHAESSFGAASYLIQRPEGNILVDSPRFSPPLVQQLESRGGIRYLYLTHQDDVADHQKFAEYFRCDRILHQDEINPRTREVEIQLTGYEPIELESDMVIIPLPGHTKGHTVLLYQNKFLFTGDCLAWSHRLNQLIAFRDACWYSWPELIKSLHKLKDYSFEWILPGHGRRYHAENAQQMQQELQRCLAWMETQ